MIICAGGPEKCYAAFLIFKEGDIQLKEEKDLFVLCERKRSYWWIWWWFQKKYVDGVFK